ncbi:MAG: tRNA (N(6)-L-threonylcarbamoyladenosine(37)-C(2))-methylthiotransferase MtaB [Treponema sp.]|nr:tRNA (N(6)-L-threonylcarbamoyladenosine(37)-C(2))-methylthiotransferase MtaB [Treponema sp.]
MADVRIETLGCRLNQIESEAAGRLFADAGLDVCMEGVTASSSDDKTTKLVIINTCAVTQKAEQKARRLIRLVLKKYCGAAVLVTGCYAQLSKAQIEKMDERVVVLGGQIKSRLSKVPVLVKDFCSGAGEFDFAGFIKALKDQVISLPVTKPDFPEDSFKLSTTSLLAHSRASLKIQDGCNNNCSYCTIHIARGHSVSLDVNTALERVQALEKNGYDEVVLTTINIAQYKGKLNETWLDFTGLLEYLLANTSKINFRISSLYPEVVTDEFCRVISSDRVRPHFHISVQSGSDKILGLMNRKYVRDDVINACSKIRSAKPDAFIACDIITGFPGESDEDFEQTLDLCRRCNFAWIHAFPFSERPGTPACSMKPKIPQSVSGERARCLTELAIKNKIEYIRGFEGKEVSAVVEKLCQIKADGTRLYHCMTQNFIHCELKSDVELEPNQAVMVKILEPLADRIKKGGEIEAITEYIHTIY